MILLFYLCSVITMPHLSSVCSISMLDLDVMSMSYAVDNICLSHYRCTSCESRQPIASQRKDSDSTSAACPRLLLSTRYVCKDWHVYCPPKYKARLNLPFLFGLVVSMLAFDASDLSSVLGHCAAGYPWQTGIPSVTPCLFHTV
jgi:hypothetical protein